MRCEQIGNAKRQAWLVVHFAKCRLQRCKVIQIARSGVSLPLWNPAEIHKIEYLALFIQAHQLTLGEWNRVIAEPALASWRQVQECDVARKAEPFTRNRKLPKEELQDSRNSLFAVDDSAGNEIIPTGRGAIIDNN